MRTRPRRLPEGHGMQSVRNSFGEVPGGQDSQDAVRGSGATVPGRQGIAGTRAWGLPSPGQ